MKNHLRSDEIIFFRRVERHSLNVSLISYTPLFLENGLAFLVQGPRVAFMVHWDLQFLELRLTPRVALDQSPLDWFAEVFFEVIREPP